MNLLDNTQNQIKNITKTLLRPIKTLLEPSNISYGFIGLTTVLLGYYTFFENNIENPLTDTLASQSESAASEPSNTSSETTTASSLNPFASSETSNTSSETSNTSSETSNTSSAASSLNPFASDEKPIISGGKRKLKKTRKSKK
jgi:cytoskeletal protein RodZ